MRDETRERLIDELTAAGADVVEVTSGTVRGRAGHWNLYSHGGLWVAEPVSGWGMPLAHAVHLHETPLAGASFGSLWSVAGQLIRTEGCASAPHPAKYCGGRASVTTYHIDSVGALRLFVDYVTRPGLTEAVVASKSPYPLAEIEVRS